LPHHQAVAARPRHANREIGLALRQTDDFRLHHQIDTQRRVALPEPRQRRRQHVRHHRFRRRDPNRLGPRTLPQRRGGAFDLGHLAAHALRQPCHPPPVLGQQRPVRPAVDQPQPERPLQRPDAPRHGRCGDAEFVCGSAQRPRLRHRQQIGKIVPLHVRDAIPRIARKEIRFPQTDIPCRPIRP